MLVEKPFVISESFTIPAGSILKIAMAGRSFSLIELSGANTVQCKFKNIGSSETFFPIRKGLNFKFLKADGDENFYFTEIELFNNSLVAVSGQYVITNGQVEDTALSLTGAIASDTSADDIVCSDNVTINSFVPNGAQLIIPADASRKMLTLQNIGNVACYVGCSLINPASRGILLRSGETFSIESKGALYGATIAGSTNISIMESHYI